MGECARPTGSYYARGHGSKRSKRSPGERSDTRDHCSRISLRSCGLPICSRCT